jgi:hypothetical protein
MTATLLHDASDPVQAALYAGAKELRCTEVQADDLACALAKHARVDSAGRAVLNETNQPLSATISQSWLRQRRPHLLPLSLALDLNATLAADAFVNGNVTARGKLARMMSPEALDAVARQYGLKSAFDFTTKGVPPADTDAAPVKPNGTGKPKAPARNPADADNPWSERAWNISAQGRYVREHGMDKARETAAKVGSRVGATKPTVAA